MRLVGAREAAVGTGMCLVFYSFLHTASISTNITLQILRAGWAPGGRVIPNLLAKARARWRKLLALLTIKKLIYLFFGDQLRTNCTWLRFVPLPQQSAPYRVPEEK